MSQGAYNSGLPENNFQAIQPGTTQNITTSGTSTPSTAFGGNTTLVRLVCTADCYVAFGSAPAATTSSLFLPAGVVEYFGVAAGSKVAVIQSTAAGTLNVTEGA